MSKELFKFMMFRDKLNNILARRYWPKLIEPHYRDLENLLEWANETIQDFKVEKT